MKVLTAKGKLFEYKWCGIGFTGNLGIGLVDADIAEAVSTFSDKTETCELTLYKDQNIETASETITGYTRFIGVRIDEVGNTTNITLGREYAQ